MASSPFKFLDSYGRDDIGSFFGRERETDELFRQCFITPVLVVYGGSGTGKTSLVQCGLASRFQGSDWLPITVRRAGDMLAATKEAVQAHTLTPGRSDALNDLLANLYLDHFKPIYLLFDQFEELFIFGDTAECSVFFQAIGELLKGDRNAHVVFIVREEYLAELTRYEHLVPDLIENRYRVERMPRSHAVEVVEKLCASAHVPVEAGFGEALVDKLDPEGRGVELAYLQVFLDRCWRSRKGAELFSAELLESIGQVEDLLGAFLDEQVAQMEAPQRAETLLKAFVSDQGTKRQLTPAEAQDWAAALGKPMEASEVDALLQEFVARRLMRDRDERGRFELMHDALARQVFERITRAEQELIEVRQFVVHAHGQYQKRGVKLTANDLAYLRPYRNQLHLKGDVKEFVERGFGEEERREKRRRRKRWFLAGVVSIVLIGLGFFSYSTVQRLKNEERINKSNEALHFAKVLLEKYNPFGAFLAAERAYELDPDIEAEQALLLAYNHMYPRVIADPGTIARVAADKRTFLVIGAERGFNVYDMEGSRLFSKPLSSHNPAGVQYITGGAHILCVDSAVNIYDLSGKSIFSCDTSQWRGHNTIQGFIGVMRDSLIIERNGGFEVLPWTTPPLIGRVARTNVGLLDDTTAFFFCQDSLRLVQLNGRPRSRDASGYPQQMSYVFAQTVQGKIAVRGPAGTHLFDPRARKWSDLRLKGTGPMQWTDFFSNAVVVQVGQEGTCFMELHQIPMIGTEPVRMDGWFLNHFPIAGTTLATISESENGEAILYGPQGQELLRTKGYPASFDDKGFVVVSDSTVDLDRLTIWNAQGQLISTIGVKKVSAMYDPPVHAIWLDHVNDTAVMGFISDAVINSQQVKEFRVVRAGRTTCYVTLPRDIKYRHRTMFQTLANGSSLVSQGQFGQVLVGANDRRTRVPYRRSNIFYSAQAYRPVGFVQLDQMGSSGFRVPGDNATAYRSLDVHYWRPDSIWTVSLTKERKNARTLRYHIGERNISPLGDWFKVVHTSKDAEGALQVSIWNTTTGSEFDNHWLRAAEDVLWSEQDSSTALVIGSDSLFILDRGLSRCLLAVERDSSMIASESDERYPVFWNKRKGKVQVIDLGAVRVHEMHIGLDQLDKRVDKDLGTYPDRCRISAQNDSTVYFVLNYWSGGGVVQRFVNGMAEEAIVTPGECRMVYRKDKAYLRSTMVTVKDGDYGIQKDRLDRVIYYHFVKEASGRRLRQSPMKFVGSPELEYNIMGYRIRHWEDDLLEVEGRLIDAHLPQRLLSTHRLTNEFEQFPMSAKEAIRMVREDMVYGDPKGFGVFNWKE